MFLTTELKAKGKKDKRFTLFLLLGSLFLVFIVLQIINTNSRDALTGSGLSLSATGSSLSLVSLGLAEKEFSARPWNLSFFFFEKLPINKADKEALTTIKGIGPKLADSILQHRSAHGPFKERDDLLKIRGIGSKRVIYFEKMFDFEDK